MIKKLLFLICLPVSIGAAFGQYSADKNIIKWNATGVLLNNYSFQYERLIAPKITVGTGFRFMPEGRIPWLSSFESLIDDEETFSRLRDVRISHTSIAPEARFYFGKNEGARGFYIAPFARYSNYSISFPSFTFEVEDGNTGSYTEETIAISGKLNSFTGGVLFGAQWKISKWVYLDWWILGGSYGSATGKLSGTSTYPLDQDAQDALREALDELDADPIKVTSEVDANGARATLKGPWSGLRTGLSIGTRF